MTRSMLFINPKAGMLKGCLSPQQVKEKLRGLELEPDITIAQSGRGITNFIKAVKKQKPEIVLIAGGDGTTATILKQLKDEKVTFGLIPTGSTNNIGQSIGLSDDLEHAVEVINAGKIAAMDFGLAGRQIFIESVGLGLLAQIMDSIGEQDTKKEVLKIAAQTLKTIVVREAVPVTINTRDKKITTDTLWLTITNTGRAAAALVDPTSDVHDHLLELVYCEPLTPAELAQYIMAYLRNSHIKKPKFHRLRANQFTLTLTQSAPVHIDGQVKQARSLTVRVLPSVVKVFVP